MWKRFISKTGNAYYQTNISDTVILQIWKDTKEWNWVIIGWLLESGPLVTRHGICKTMKEAVRQIEAILPQQEEQIVLFGEL